MIDNVMYKRAYVEVNLNNLIHNYNEIQRVVGSGVDVMCVVKANAYGHGDSNVVKELYKNGARLFGVATFLEASRLHRYFKDIYVMNLGYLDPALVSDAVNLGLKQTIVSLEHARALNDELIKIDKTLSCHIKLDTGMTRIGINCIDGDYIKALDEIFLMSNISIEGVFSHFSVADGLDDESVEFTTNQINLYKKIMSELDKKGITIKYKHCANSPAILKYKESYFDFVRAGTILYGLSPSYEMESEISNLRQVFQLKSQISVIKEVEKGRSVSYGRRYITNKLTKLATITIGYADGYPRNVYNRAYATLNNTKCNVIGQTCMDQIVIDVTDVSDPKVGDIVTLIGFDNISLNASDFANIISTIPINVSCSLGARLYRVYMKDDKMVDNVCYI